MEIIKRGKLPLKEYEAKCSYCGTEVRFHEKEGKITYDQRDGNFITVLCPICHSRINKNL